MEQTIKANGIDICYETFGDSTNPTVLFVMGLGAQMISWPDLYMAGLRDAGYHVVRYDNRDVGLSQKFHDSGVPDFQALGTSLANNKTPDVPYLLSDMAADGIGLLDALNIDRAHIIGASMGGMIVQQMAIDHGHRVSSMISIMSNTGDPSLPPPTAEAIEVLTQPGPDSDDIEQLVDHAMKNRKVIGGDGFIDDEEARQLSAAVIRRKFYPVGAARQRAGIMASGSRTAALKGLSTPTLVIHGNNDPLVPVEGGIHTAETIPNARLEILDGMGHAQFPRYQSQVLGLMLEHIRQN